MNEIEKSDLTVLCHKRQTVGSACPLAFASNLKFAPLALPCLSVLTYRQFSFSQDNDADFTTVCLRMPVLVNIDQERTLHAKT